MTEESPRTKPIVLVFKENLLPISETFIAAQTRCLSSFSARLIGLGPASPSLDIPPDSILLTTSHSAGAQFRQKLYRRIAVAPGFHRRAGAVSANIVHAHFASGGRSALPLARCLKLPLIVTLHGSDVSKHMDFKKRYERLWESAALFLCVSEFIRLKALAAGFPNDKLRVHYIGVDLDAFQRQGQAGRRETVVFVGRLVEKKGCAFLLQAMAQVAKTQPNAETVILGDGPLRSSLETLAGRLGISCRFLGSQPSTVVRDWLSSARLLCVPSVTASDGDSEGLPTVLMEAQAMGTPVVTTQHAGNPEAVLDGRTGLVAPEGDSDALAKCISQLIDDQSFWKACCEQTRDWIRSRFDIKQQTRQLESFYTECIGLVQERRPLTGDTAHAIF